MRTTRRLLVIAVAVALPLAVMTAATAAPPADICETNPDHRSCPTTTTEWDNCADLGWGDPFDGSLTLWAANKNDCNDISHQPNGATFAFDFAVTPADAIFKTSFILGIRNSVPGDWCDGLWTYYDAAENVIFGSQQDGVLYPSIVGNGYSATFVLDEVLEGTNCTTDGVVNWSDNDPDWVLTLMKGGGKPLKRDQDITVTWTVTAP